MTYVSELAGGVGERPAPGEGATWMPGRAFLFVLADEVLSSGKLVRKVLAVPPRTQAEIIAARPEVYGIRPETPGANVSLGEHALGNDKSPYISASSKPAARPTYRAARCTST
jgi:hypothetical protein